MISLTVISVLHAVKRDPKGFEDVHGNKSAIVSFQDETKTIVSSISYSTYKILLLTQLTTDNEKEVASSLHI